VIISICALFSSTRFSSLPLLTLPFSHFLAFSLCCGSVDMEALTPLRLKDGDVICMGSTELLVRISNFDDQDVEEQG
jgi:hypothetical protein